MTENATALGLELLEPRLFLSTTPVLSQMFQSAEALQVTPVGTIAIPGSITSSHQNQSYQFRAPATGQYRFELLGSDGRINPMLQLYDAKYKCVRQNDDASSLTRNSVITINAAAGQRFYVVAESSHNTRGSYQFRIIGRDDYGNTINQATDVPLYSDGSGGINGIIQYINDVDVFTVAATKTGTMKAHIDGLVDQNPSFGHLSVYDANGNYIRNISLSDGGVRFSVTAGQKFYIKAFANGGKMGIYRVTIATDDPAVPPTPVVPPEPPVVPPTPPADPVVPPVDPVTPDPNVPSTPTDPTPGDAVTASVISTSAGVQLRILGTDSADILTLSQLGGTYTLITSAGSQNFSDSITSICVYGFGGDDVIRIMHSVTTSVMVDAGSGNNAVYDAGQGANVINAGAGDDTLVSIGNAGGTVTGGGGNDSIWCDSSDVLTDAPKYAANAIHKVSKFYQPYTNDANSSAYVPLTIDGQSFAEPATSYPACSYKDFSSIPLFANGPQYHDIAQGGVGDCYFLATLASLAQQSPQSIRQSITALGDGTYAVRFYQNGNQVFVRVDGQLPVNAYGSLVYARTGANGTLWVPLMEKAYAHFRYGQDSYDSISGGWMGNVFYAVTGGLADDNFLNGTPTDVYNYLSDKLSSGRAVTAGTDTRASGPVFSSHAYMVESVQIASGIMEITVYNPWGYDGSNYDSNAGDGLVTLTIDQFEQYFIGIVAA